MTLEQTKLVGLTMELDLKVREYNMLCEELEILKRKIANENDIELLPLKQKFEVNHKEIVELNKQIQKLKENKKNAKVKTEEEIFKNIKNKNEYTDNKITEVIEFSKKSEKEKNLTIISHKHKWVKKIIEKIKSIFKI